MTQPPAVSDELERFIREELGLFRKREIKPEDQMERDFGVEGDPADDFMAAFSQRFNVEPGDFVFERYFEFEGFSGPLFFITNWWLRKQGMLQVPKEVLTVSMLQRAIELGVWDTEKLRQARSDPE